MIGPAVAPGIVSARVRSDTRVGPRPPRVMFVIPPPVAPLRSRKRRLVPLAFAEPGGSAGAIASPVPGAPGADAGIVVAAANVA